jgi:Ca-activated chloride channel homolog
MTFNAAGYQFWVWIAGWLLIPALAFLIWRGNRMSRRDAHEFGRYETLLRLMPEDIWKTPEDARQAASGDQRKTARLVRLALRRRKTIKSSLILCAMLFLIIGLGKPQWGARQEKVFKRGIDLVIAVDTSESMKAEDIAPSRMSKARSEIAALLDRLEGNRAALIGFATTTKLHCPLTLDFRGLKSILDNSLSYGIGTNIHNAIEEALKALKNSETKSKAILILSDGEGHTGDIENAIADARSAGVHIFALGVGTAEGGPIPEDSKDNTAAYKKYKGELVWTKLDETTLQQLAKETGGAYFKASDTELEADALAAQIENLEKTEFSQTMTTQKEDRFGIFLFIAIILLAIEAVLGDYGKTEWEEI